MMAAKKKYFYTYRDYHLYGSDMEAKGGTRIYICSGRPTLHSCYCDENHPDHDFYTIKEAQHVHAHPGFCNLPYEDVYGVDYASWLCMTRISIPLGEYTRCSVEWDDSKRFGLSVQARRFYNSTALEYVVAKSTKDVYYQYHLCGIWYEKLSNAVPELGEHPRRIRIVER